MAYDLKMQKCEITHYLQPQETGQLLLLAKKNNDNNKYLQCIT